MFKITDIKMRKLTALCVALALAFGCATSVSLPDRLDKFVEKTEKEYKNYTEKEWEKSKAEYQSLVAEWEENYDSYSTSDKVRAMKAMSRYGTMVVQSEVSGASETISDIIESIPEAINDIIEGIDTAAIREGVDGLKNGIEGIIESIDTARLRKSVESLTENIDTAKLREKLEAIVNIFTAGAEDNK